MVLDKTIAFSTTAHQIVNIRKPSDIRKVPRLVHFIRTINMFRGKTKNGEAFHHGSLIKEATAATRADMGSLCTEVLYLWYVCGWQLAFCVLTHGIPVIEADDICTGGLRHYFLVWKVVTHREMIYSKKEPLL